MSEPLESEPQPEPQLKFIDLFCGIGGFHQAMKRLPFSTECVFACDIDKDCREIYHKNYGVLPSSDITQVDEKLVPGFDVLCAGFPCQSFSQAGKKLSMEDKRGNLFEHILRIAKEKRPKYMFLENVKHIKRISEGKVFEHILKRIRETGYMVQVEELSPHQLGIPQHRERVIFICRRNDISDLIKEIPFIIPPFSLSPAEQIEKILIKDQLIKEKYKISKEVEDILNVWDEMVQVFEIGENLSPTILCREFQKTPTPTPTPSSWKQTYIEKNKRIFHKYESQWLEWLDKHNTLLSKKEIYGKLEWQSGKKREGDSIWNYFIQLRQSGIRVKKCDYFPALVAIVQTPIYAKEKRYICPRECARLQSFPEDFQMHPIDKIAYKQFGNAVNVDVVHFFLNNVLNC